MKALVKLGIGAAVLTLVGCGGWFKAPSTAQVEAGAVCVLMHLDELENANSVAGAIAKIALECGVEQKFVTNIYGAHQQGMAKAARGAKAPPASSGK